MKKSLSDLLREEVSKDPASEVETPQTPPAKTSSRRKSASSEPTTDSTQTVDKIAFLESELEKQKNLVQTLHEQIQHTEMLETEVKQLKQSRTDLEHQLQAKQILETELTEQKTLAQTLSNQLTEAETKIEEQTHLIDKLYAQLMEKQEVRLLEPELEPVPEPEPEAIPEPPKAIVKKSSPSFLQYHRVERLVAPNTSRANLSNETIGWFD